MKIGAGSGVQLGPVSGGLPGTDPVEIEQVGRYPIRSCRTGCVCELALDEIETLVEELSEKKIFELSVLIEELGKSRFMEIF